MEKLTVAALMKWLSDAPPGAFITAGEGPGGDFIAWYEKDDGGDGKTLCYDGETWSGLDG